MAIKLITFMFLNRFFLFWIYLINSLNVNLVYYMTHDVGSHPQTPDMGALEMHKLDKTIENLQFCG